jgi:hypothetical protein
LWPRRFKAMKKNVGGIDKTIRIIIGTVLIVIGIFIQMNTGLRIGVFIVAGIALATAFVSF